MLGPGGQLCAEVLLPPGTNPASILASLQACGAAVKAFQVVQLGQGRTGNALRLVAARV